LYPSGSIYFGRHKDFFKYGLGKMLYMNGDLYEGTWENDKRNGKGRFLYGQDGSLGVYVGEFLDDKRTGKGRYYDAVKEEIYEGEWNNDKRNGEGTLVKRHTCEVITGEFRNDLFEGKQKYEKVLLKADIEKYFSRAIKDN
jgi:hypothetical protein